MTSHYFCLWIFFHGETWKVHWGMVPNTVTQYNTVTPPVWVVQIRISVAVGLSGPTSKHRSFVRYQEDQPKWRWQLVSFFKDASFLSHLCHFFLHIFAVSQLFYHSSCFCCLLIIVFCPLHQPACSFPFNNIHTVQLDMTWHVDSFPRRFHLKIFYFIFCEVSQICPLRSICLHSGGWKAGLNGPRFVRTIDVLSDAKKVFFCKFGIDFAFYNLAGCLAWRGSWLCPSLNIFGLKTGRGVLGLEEGYQ